MLCALVYWLLRRLIGLAGGPLESGHNDVEVLVLRHQLAVLIGGVSGVQPAQESGLLVVRVRGRPRCLATQMASLSCAASVRAEP
jgi:hypothetical protein